MNNFGHESGSKILGKIWMDIENNEKIQQIVFGTSALCWSRAGLCGNLSKFCHKPHIGS